MVSPGHWAQLDVLNVWVFVCKSVCVCVCVCVRAHPPVSVLRV